MSEVCGCESLLFYVQKYVIIIMQKFIVPFQFVIRFFFSKSNLMEKYTWYLIFKLIFISFKK